MQLTEKPLQVASPIYVPNEPARTTTQPLPKPQRSVAPQITIPNAANYTKQLEQQAAAAKRAYTNATKHQATPEQTVKPLTDLLGLYLIASIFFGAIGSILAGFFMYIGAKIAAHFVGPIGGLNTDLSRRPTPTPKPAEPIDRVFFHP